MVRRRVQGRGTPEVDGLGGAAVTANHGMFEVADNALRLHLRVVEHVLNRTRGGAGYLGGFISEVRHQRSVGEGQVP